MAKSRMVNTRFWIDDYISNLDPIEKLLFLYFLTNPSTDISGVYEVPLKTIAVDTGIEKEMVVKILKRFRRDGKITYKDGWVGVKNFIKHQSINPKVQQGIKIGLNKAPKDILDSLSVPMDSLSHSNPNPNPNPNPNSNPNVATSVAGVVEIIKLFEEVNPNASEWYGNKTQRSAVKWLIEKVGREPLERLVKKLPEITARKFAPKITSPHELKRDWAKLAIFIKQEKVRSSDRVIL